MKIILAALIVVSAFGQGKQNVIKTGTSDESALTRLDPSSTYASRPGSPVNKQVWTMTDTLCDGTGSGPTACRWNGSSWQQTSPTGGGSGIACQHNTVTAATLAGLSSGASKEVTIISSVPGTTRYDQVLVSETVLFTGTTGLTVSMGRPGSTTHDELTGASLALQVSAGDTNFFSSRPIPPQLTTTYDIVLAFSVASGNVNSATAGTLYYEICSYPR